MFRCSQLSGSISTSDKTKRPLGEKKRQQITILALAETTVYERKADAGDAFYSPLAHSLGHLPACVMLPLIVTHSWQPLRDRYGEMSPC